MNAAAARAARPHPAPLLATLLTVVVVTVWLVARDHGPVRPGYAGGPLAMLAAYLACRRIAATAGVPDPVRAFWRLFAHSSVWLGVASVAALLFADNERGMPPHTAAPALVGVVLSVLAFRRLPTEPRSALRWAQILLDGATVVVAGGLIFSYVVLEAGPALPAGTRNGAVLVGVGSLAALVVMGRAALSRAGGVDPVSLRVLAVAPVVGVITTVLLITGGEAGRLIVSVLAVPVVAAAVTSAAYRQQRMLGRPAASCAGRAARRVYNALPLVAVVATATLVITVSARQLTAHQRIVMIGAVLIAAFVVARQLLGLRANERMLAGIRRQQAELEHAAAHDPLTGCANRTRFDTLLDERLAARRGASVLLIDIDDFKTVNDTMGHAVGDRLLVEIAARLRGYSAAGHLPSRLGGDEFAVLLDTGDPARAQEAAGQLVAALSVPFQVGEHELLAQASIGVAVAGPGATADGMLRDADIAMYAAKASGKAAWARFEPHMRSEVVNQARLGSELHHALARDELHLVYQPVFDLTTGRTAGAEALVRWHHPARGPVSPAEFIPVAERSGLIVPLGRWVLRTACAQLAAWQASHGDTAICSVNVNVAARQLRDPGFVAEVSRVLEATGLRPEHLVLEMTESSVLEGRQVRETLDALHALGVRLALDDFGTGQSSLSLVRAFPVDVLKLDKSFVDGICAGADRGRLAVAAAVAQLAENLDLYAVAEGIETAGQLSRLRELGYRFGQGYHLAKPLPPEELAELMARDARSVAA